ncbi:MAG: electron transport complex subunit E [Candidatus Theseobacter exili]|nr:electron transport complex subunit E [Candidatus Theseobacter exili]
MNLWDEFSKGIIKENPIFRLVLGMCPTLAVSTTAINGLGMGIASTVVLLGSNIVVSLVRSWVPARVRIPIYIVIIASFVTVTGMVMEAYFYNLYKSLGIFLPLIVVNCIILGRAEGFASKNSLLPSIVDAIGMGIGFTLALFILASIREALGSGTIFGINVFGASYRPILIMILPPGAFIALGLLMGAMNKLQKSEG